MTLAISAFFGVSANEAARAVPISYSLSAVASGELGSTVFNNATVTITATADTSSIGSYTSPGQPQPNFYAVQDITCSVFISGVGTANFTGPELTFVNTLTSVIGIGNGSSDILDSMIVGAFSDYHLDTALGPVTGTSIQQSSGSLNDVFATDQGNFYLTSLTTSTPVSFMATGGLDLSVPDHGSTLGLLLLGLSGLAGHRWITQIRRTPRPI